MDLDQVARTGRPMQAIDVLRQHRHAAAIRFEPGDRLVGGIRPHAAAIGLDLGDVLPGDLRTQRQHVARKSLLDLEAFVGHVVVVETADAAISRQAGVGGNSGAGDEQDAPRLGAEAGDLVEQAVGGRGRHGGIVRKCCHASSQPHAHPRHPRPRPDRLQRRSPALRCQHGHPRRVADGLLPAHFRQPGDPGKRRSRTCARTSRPSSSGWPPMATRATVTTPKDRTTCRPTSARR